MIIKSDRLSDMLAEGQRENTKDPLIIVPTPNLDALRSEGTASIDLRLGTWFAHLKQTQMAYLPLLPSTGSATVGPDLTSTTYIPFGSSYILHPQSFVLAVTLEWISLPNDLAAYVIGKSSWGRAGLIIATAAGVHPGYKGCLTLELTNVGEIPIQIRPGVRICQLFIHKLEAAKTGAISASSFSGSRRPMLRPLTLDAFAAKLSSAYDERNKMHEQP
ncbi:MAG TPA: dCTP deaminase [Candidatus Acidoferrum sp.]|nr:dCTP deaminase [Candidatus Acidoferrum sp.]